MPNWCMNSAIFHHVDPAMIQKLAEAFKRGDVCMTFVPIEEEWAKLTADPNFSDPSNSIRVRFQTDHWGTKWDFGDDVDIHLVNPNTLSAPYFDTAWSPPTKLYDALVAQGFEIQAYYFEPGCGFCGEYQNGSDNCYEIQDPSSIPNDIRDTFDTDQWYHLDEENEEEN